MHGRLLVFLMGLSLAAFAGCGGDKADDDYKPVQNAPEVPEAAHPTEGEHGGPLFDLGGHEAMVELVMNEDNRQLTIYLVDHDDVAKPWPVDATGAYIALHQGTEESSLTALTAEPQPGDPEGKSSRFTLSGDKLPEIHDVHDIDGELKFELEGEVLKAAIEPEEHDHEPAAGER